MTRKIHGLTEEDSLLAHAALDALMNGETLFGISGGWKKHLPQMARRLDALVALLRSDEPLPTSLRMALADALDLGIDTPIQLVEKIKNRPRATTILHWMRKSQRVFADYQNLQREPTNLSATAALAKAADDNGVNKHDAERMLTDVYAERLRSQKLEEARSRGASVSEMAAMILDPAKGSQRVPRGRKPKAR